MSYQRVRALVPVRHDGIVRIPGTTSGENGQDFVVRTEQATRLIAQGLVSYLADAEAPATGLEQVFVGADGLLRRPGGGVVGGGNFRLNALSWALLGDSMQGQSFRTYFGTTRITSLSRTDNVATLVLNVAHGLWTGRTLRIRGETVAGFNGDHTITVVDANTVTWPSVGPNATANRNNTMVMDLGRMSSGGMWLWMLIRMGGRGTLINNAGINAQTTAQMLARAKSDVVDRGVGNCVTLGGYNDLVQGFTPQQTLGNLVQIAHIFSEAGVRNYQLTPLAIGAGASTFNPTNVAHLQYVRDGLLELASDSSLPGLEVIDAYGLVVDPSTGAAREGVLGDNIHPSPRGAKILGDAVADRHLRGAAAIKRAPLNLSNVTLSGVGGYNVVKAGPYVATGGVLGTAVTGAVAQHLRAERSSGSTGSAVADVITDGDGAMLQRLVINAGGVETWSIRTTDGGDVVGLLTAGERRRLVARLRVAGLAAGAPLASLNLRAAFTIGGVDQTHLMTVDASGSAIDSDFDGVVVSEPVNVPAGSITNFFWRLDVATTGEGSPIDVAVGNVGYLLES